MSGSRKKNLLVIEEPGRICYNSYIMGDRTERITNYAGVAGIAAVAEIAIVFSGKCVEAQGALVGVAAVSAAGAISEVVREVRDLRSAYREIDRANQQAVLSSDITTQPLSLRE